MGFAKASIKCNDCDNSKRRERSPRRCQALVRKAATVVRAWPLAMLAAVLLCLANPSSAESPAELATDPSAVGRGDSTLDLRWDKSYALGVNNHYLDHETKLTGWRVSERWFFGRQRGLDSGLTLVWQRRSQQLSLSKDGVRITRRF